MYQQTNQVPMEADMVLSPAVASVLDEGKQTISAHGRIHNLVESFQFSALFYA